LRAAITHSFDIILLSVYFNFIFFSFWPYLTHYSALFFIKTNKQKVYDESLLITSDIVSFAFDRFLCLPIQTLFLDQSVSENKKNE
jgi:hypothetical protein